MICQRCHEHPATHRVTSDLTEMLVCDDCARTAFDVASKQPPDAEGPITVRPLERRDDG